MRGDLLGQARIKQRDVLCRKVMSMNDVENRTRRSEKAYEPEVETSARCIERRSVCGAPTNNETAAKK